jgi:hypothetical protein
MRVESQLRGHQNNPGVASTKVVAGKRVGVPRFRIYFNEEPTGFSDDLNMGDEKQESSRKSRLAFDVRGNLEQRVEMKRLLLHIVMSIMFAVH